MTVTERTGTLVGLVVLVLGALLVLPLLTMGGGMMGGGMWGPGMHTGGTAPGWVWLVGLLVQLGILAAVVAAGYYLLRAVVGDGASDPAVAQLRTAYARGDLTDEEYERRLERLRDDDGGS